MVAITLRAGLTRGLTSGEIDANFTALNTELGTKVTQAQARSAISVSGSLTYNPSTGVIGFTETPLTSANIVTALGFTPLSTAGGTLSGGLTVTGNLLLAPSAGGSRTIGFSGGTNTTLVLQGGGASGTGANLELTASYQAYLDATTTQFRSIDGATTFLQSNATATNVVTGALQQGGNQVLHAGNFGTYAAAASHTHSYVPLAGGTMTGNLTMAAGTSLRGTHGAAWGGEGNKIEWHANNLYIQNAGGGSHQFRRTDGVATMEVNYSGQIYSGSYGWLHDYFASKNVFHHAVSITGNCANAYGGSINAAVSGNTLQLSLSAGNCACNCNCACSD